MASPWRPSRAAPSSRARSSRRSGRILLPASPCPIDFCRRRRNTWSSSSRARCRRSSTVSPRSSVSSSGTFMTVLLGRSASQSASSSAASPTPAASPRAPRSAETPSISNRIRPGLMTATQPSGAPLPLPMRVSCGFLVIGLSGKHANPDLAAALDAARQRDARRFDLPIGQPARLERHQPEVAERDRRPAPRQPAHPSALLLAILDFLRHQHRNTCEQLVPSAQRLRSH